MSPRVFILAITLLGGLVGAIGEGSTSMAEVSAMERVFARSEEVHQRSMAAITKGMSSKKAWHVLEKNNLTFPALIQMKSHLLGSQFQLRKASPTGYSGVDKARNMLNEMIYKSMTKYDEEISTCTMGYAASCAAMESCRGKIAASNYVASHSRKLILDAQATIDTCEKDIPETKLRLAQHLQLCKDELGRMHAREKLLDGDIAVMTKVVSMTQCGPKNLLQMNLLQCHDPCTHESFITFQQDDLKQQVGKLQSSASHGLIQENFQDLFEGSESMRSVGLHEQGVGENQLSARVRAPHL